MIGMGTFNIIYTIYKITCKDNLIKIRNENIFVQNRRNFSFE